MTNDPWALPANASSIIVKRDGVERRSSRGVDDFIRSQQPDHMNGALFALTRMSFADVEAALMELAQMGLQPGVDVAVGDMIQGPLIECTGIVFTCKNEHLIGGWTVNVDPMSIGKRFGFPHHRIKAGYTHDIIAAHGDLSLPIGHAVIHVDAETLAKIRSGEEVELYGPKIAYDDEEHLPARWVFNERGFGSAYICLSRGEGEEEEFLEITSMQFDEDPTILCAPPMFENTNDAQVISLTGHC